MKKVFISYSYSKRKDFEEFHLILKNFLRERFSIEAYAFVFDFTEMVEDHELMNQALAKVKESDLVFIELSNQSVGAGIEAGFAKAIGKPIIYLHQKNTEKKQVMSGVADEVITYENIDDLLIQLGSVHLLQS